MRPLLSIFKILSYKDIPTKKDPHQNIWAGKFAVIIVELKALDQSPAQNDFDQAPIRDGVTDYLTVKDNRLYQITLWNDQEELKRHVFSGHAKTLDAPLLIEN